ncbi:MAG TPA: carboxypeptidase-like regulatory domain-containing protein [Vicinamibacterales bacterium]
MNRCFVVLSIVLVGLGAGCDRSTTSPSPVIPPQPPAARPPAPGPATRTLYGYVNDTAFRPIEGVRVEVIDGPDAGTQLTSDGQGRFSYVGSFPERVSMRATKAGYTVATSTAFFSAQTETAWVWFELPPIASPANPEGNYHLTLDLDAACQGFPGELRTRSYEAQLRYRSRTAFNGEVTGAMFAPFSNQFFVGVAGDYVAISTEAEGPAIVEQVGPQSYISFFGVAGATVPMGGLPTISAPFRGVIEYCELKAPVGQYYDCSDTLAAVKTQCTSENSRLTLTPR